ncbi:hypothetical protein [Brevibacillus daliensis]|nr:hypothetical protein [Brevibacillus daliensis]
MKKRCMAFLAVPVLVCSLFAVPMIYNADANSVVVANVDTDRDDPKS